MAIGKQLHFASVDELWLDPENPRIGRSKRREHLDQPDLLKTMARWTIDELVDSFLSAGGFWTQDALIVVKQDLQGEERLVVVEGNRRLAALKLMRGTLDGAADTPEWLMETMEDAGVSRDDDLFQNIPYLLADSRKDIEAYLGFRHVTGIKEWAPTEKAEFIAKLIDENGFTYKQVAKRIGSRADFVRHHYVAFKILQQTESLLPRDEWIEIETKFSVLLLALRSLKVRDFLGVDVVTDPAAQIDPIPISKKQDLRDFIAWVFGRADQSPIISDSRQIDKFAEILVEPRSVEYLRSNPAPSFDTAYSLTKASSDLVVDPLREAARQVKLALSEIGERGAESEVQSEAWPVIEGGCILARKTNGTNLERARELIVGP